MRLVLIVALVSTLTSSASFASDDHFELVQLVQQRRAVMFEMQRAYFSLLAVKNGESTDLAAASAGAKSVNENIALFVQLLKPGTAKGEVPNSRAKPEIWSQSDKFAAAVNALSTTSAALTAAASSGDMESFTSQFDRFAEACLGCHELRPSAGGRFRAEK